jgi:hypothetical protein
MTDCRFCAELRSEIELLKSACTRLTDEVVKLRKLKCALEAERLGAWTTGSVNELGAKLK